VHIGKGGGGGSGKLFLGRSTSTKDSAFFDPKVVACNRNDAKLPMVMKMDSMRYKLWFSKQKSKNVFGYIVMVFKRPMNSSNNHLQNRLFLFSSFLKTTNSAMLYKGDSMLYKL
jgi:hypothetical protein